VDWAFLDPKHVRRIIGINGTMEHAPKTNLHDGVACNNNANDEKATALPIRAAVANIPIDETHSLGGKNS
jgi:hypothetical protein